MSTGQSRAMGGKTSSYVSGKQPKSKQTRVLQRRLTLHTIAAWLIYSAAFVVLAVFLNAYVVPKLADFVVSRTALTINFDPMDYLRKDNLQQLLDSYLRSLDEGGAEYELVLNDYYEAIAAALASDESVRSAFPETPEGAETGSAAGAETGTEAGAGLEIEVAEKPSEASDAENDLKYLANVPIGSVEFTSFDGIPNTDESTQVITPYFLASEKAMQECAIATAQGDWQLWAYDSPYDGGNYEYGMGAFQAREISFYNAVKQFKLPVAIVIYLLGCLGIIMYEMRRAMRYFDQLSGAVAGLITDRQQPVQLSSELSLAQDELNNIRLEALNDERIAQSAEQRKNELVAYLAHDIRTPLTSIIGYLSMLDESPDLPEEQRLRFTHTAFAKAESLESLINEFFEITRYNLQSIPLERSWVNARLMLSQIADEFLPQAAERSVKIRVSAPDDGTFFVDAAKLARAIENVLRNAIAYADEGTEVQVDAVHIGDKDGEDNGESGGGIKGEASEAAGESKGETLTAGEARWEVTITDTGREISEVHLESIFEKFYREDAARSTEGGTGLGLAIAKEIVVAHGGAISAQSRNGKTTFTITLPAFRAEATSR